MVTLAITLFFMASTVLAIPLEKAENLTKRNIGGAATDGTGDEVQVQKAVSYSVLKIWPTNSTLPAPIIRNNSLTTITKSNLSFPSTGASTATSTTAATIVNQPQFTTSTSTITSTISRFTQNLLDKILMTTTSPTFTGSSSQVPPILAVAMGIPQFTSSTSAAITLSQTTTVPTFSTPTTTNQTNLASRLPGQLIPVVARSKNFSMSRKEKEILVEEQAKVTLSTLATRAAAEFGQHPIATNDPMQLPTTVSLTSTTTTNKINNDKTTTIITWANPALKARLEQEAMARQQLAVSTISTQTTIGQTQITKSAQIDQSDFHGFSSTMQSFSPIATDSCSCTCAPQQQLSFFQPGLATATPKLAPPNFNSQSPSRGISAPAPINKEIIGIRMEPSLITQAPTVTGPPPIQVLQNPNSKPTLGPPAIRPQPPAFGPSVGLVL